jgi:hypothetical protein
VDNNPQQVDYAGSLAKTFSKPIGFGSAALCRQSLAFKALAMNCLISGQFYRQKCNRRSQLG